MGDAVSHTFRQMQNGTGLFYGWFEAMHSRFDLLTVGPTENEAAALCRGSPAKSSDTHAASAHRDICPGSCVSAFLCGLLHCSAQKRLICYSDPSLPRSTWTAAATAATILMPNSSVFLITFIGSPPLLSTHTAARQSSRERVPGRTAFLRFLPRSSRNPRAPAPRRRLRRTPSPH